MLARTRIPLLACLIGAAVAACGGSGDNDDNFTSVTVFLGAQGNFEGTLDAGGVIVESLGGLEIGDREGQAFSGPVRACLSFDISSVPANATVTVARLRCALTLVAGTPFGTLGDLMVDHVNYGASFPPPGTYAGNALLGNIATLANSPTLETKTAGVLLAVNNDRAALRTRTQFRLRFSANERNFDAQDTLVRFVDAESTGGPGQVPLLELTYLVPN